MKRAPGLTRDDSKSFQPRRTRQYLVERDELEGFRMVLGGHQGGTELHRVGRRERMDTNEAFGSTPHALDVRDCRPVLEQIEGLGTR